MDGGEVVPETKGVTVTLLATVDLGPEIEGMAGRQLRMRLSMAGVPFADMQLTVSADGRVMQGTMSSDGKVERVKIVR